MRFLTSEKVFVAMAFMVIFGVLTSNVSVTGNAIKELPSNLEVVVGQRYFIEINNDFNLVLPRIESGDMLSLISDKNEYKVSILRVQQDILLRDNHVSLIIEPGFKQFTLNEGEIVSIDFDNDGREDALIRLQDINEGTAKLIISNI